MLLKIPKMATREREETYRVAKEIMDKLEGTPWENKEFDDGWSIDDYKECNDDECGEEQKSLTCPHCFQPFFAWSITELNAKMSEHIKKCKANPNRTKKEDKINVDKKIGLPTWAL